MVVKPKKQKGGKAPKMKAVGTQTEKKFFKDEPPLLTESPEKKIGKKRFKKDESMERES